jgi:putative ABC transport system permease protein
MQARAYLRQMARESRGSRARLIFFIVCLAVGVAAVVAVAGLTSSLELGIRREARQLLAADLAMRGRGPLPEEVDRLLAERPELEQARIKEMVSVVAAPPEANGLPGQSQVVELKAVAGDYPFYGELELDPAGRLMDRLDAQSVAVAPDLPPRLGVSVGQKILIGGQPFRIAALVRNEPDRGADAFTLGPRVFLSAEGLARADLERFGSQVSHRRLLKTPSEWGNDELASLAEELRGYSPEGAGAFRVETYAEAQPALRQGLRQVDRYLSLLALMSLLLGGVGVAQTTRSWLDSRTDSMAILRSIGFRPIEVTGLYLGQTLVLGLVGSAVGVALGTAVQRVAPILLGDLLPATLELQIWQPGPALRGMALGTGIALIFSLSPLAAIRRVSPLRVLRRDVEPLPQGGWSRILTVVLLIAGVWLAATAQARSPLLGLLFTGGIFLVTVVLALGAVGLVKLTATLLARLPRGRGTWRGRVWVRYGIAAIARPGSGTVGAIVAVGLGVVLLLAVALVERTLRRELTPELELRAPTAFMIDVQPDQWQGVNALLDSEGASRVQSVPVVTARLLKLDGRNVRDIAESEERDGDARWALTREQRLTYVDRLPEDNRIVESSGEGDELWSDPEVGEISVELDFARDLGVEVGTELIFDIQGVELPLRVTSLRSVDWRTFDINFFLVAEPEALAGAPHTRLATAKLPPDTEQDIQNRLAAEFPNVTLIQIGKLLAQVREVLARLARGVQFLGAFTVLAGIAILAGAISAATLRRSRELALLKTLGMTRRGVAAMLAVEFGLLGLVSGGLGVVGGTVLARTVVRSGMDLGWSFEAGPVAVALLVSVLLTALTGVVASVRALQARPIEVLRSE